MKKCGLIFAIFFVLLCSNITCYGKDKLPVDGKGYVGTLPELTRDYASNPEATEKTSSEVKPIPSKDFNSEGEIKPAPIEDPSFINIILKTDKTSKYVNDLNEFIPTLEEIYDIIDDNQNVQIFNAKVYYFNKSVEYFRDKYANRPEAEFVSYKRLMELSAHTKTVATLRSEAEKYNPYLSYSGEGYIYNPNNIREQLGYLKTEIRQTILLLRESN
ncbi:MAG: hypothetical protein SPL70_01585 [Cyanobacteriota bacterium]|nr:hypothetical protein [Cyanobacteriota bacterium]